MLDRNYYQVVLYIYILYIHAYICVCVYVDNNNVYEIIYLYIDLSNYVHQSHDNLIDIDDNKGNNHQLEISEKELSIRKSIINSLNQEVSSQFTIAIEKTDIV